MTAFRRIGLSALFVAILCAFQSPVLSAEEQVFEQKNLQKIILEPALQEVVLADEPEVRLDISLENTGDEAQKYNLRVVDFGSLDESGGVAFLGSGDPRDYDAASWLILPANDVIVAPRSKTKVTVVVRNSETLTPGGHYGALLFENTSLGTETVDETRIAIEQVFTSLIYLRKVGGEILSMELKNTDFEKKYWQLPETISLRFQNNGNTHIVPRGTVRLSDPFGRTVKKSILNKESSLILPNTTRRIEEKLDGVAFSFMPGPYTLRTDYRFDGKESFETSGETFWYWPPLSIALTALFIGGYAVYRFRKPLGKIWQKKKTE